MRLLRLRPYYFRCYGQSDWIDLDADLVILYGPNGFGKTSLVESIEWLFHGRAKRRERGVNAYSKRDYRNYYRNVHAPQDEPTFVEAEVKTEDEEIHKIRRKLDNPNKNDTSNTTVVNGTEKPFSTIGLNEDPAFDPVIPQHSLQDFILSRPIDRRDKISAALGLDPLIEFDKALDRANRRLQSTRPTRVEDANKRVQSASRKMSESQDDRIIAVLKQWRDQEFDLSEDAKRITQAVQDLLDTQEDDRDTLKQKLETHRDEIADKVFDPSSIRPPSNRENLQEALQESKRQILESELKESEQALSSYLEAAEAEYASERLSFWETGLELQNEDTDLCPMCEAPSLDEEKREEIRERLEKASGLTTAQENLQQSTTQLAQSFRQISRRLDNLFPGFLTSSNRETLIDLLEESEILQSFLTCHDASELSVVKTKDILSDLADSIDGIPELASDPSSVQEAKDRVLNLEGRVERAIESICSAAESYAGAYENLGEKLEEVIASDDAVKQADALLEPLKQWNSVKVLAEYHDLLDESREARRNLSEHLQEKQDERLEDRGTEIKEWYGVMNPEANVAPSRLDGGAESLRIYADSYGEEINVASGLSQSQANTLGLSIHFMRTLAPDSPYDFVVLDDPVQSMDDNHSEALIRDVINSLVDVEDTQTIILTHTEGLSDRIWRINFEKQTRLRYLRFSNMSKSGPTIRGKKSLSDELKKIKGLAKGNEESRELAVDRLRIATERLIRLICESQGHPIPDSKKYKMASQKLNHLRKCPGVKPEYAATIEDTINFCNPAHHDTKEWGVPTEDKIVRHRGTIYNYADKFDVLRGK